jgi:glycerate kinase
VAVRPDLPAWQAAGVRVLIAPDGFGGTLSPAQAAAAIAAGWGAAAPADELDLAPLSDGGPGLLEVLAAALPGGALHRRTVQDPLARPVTAAVLLDAGTAYVEAAAACGLHLLEDSERDPAVTTTAGVGQLVAAALELGADRVVVGLGGSATNDGGAGLLAALGVHPVDAAGDPLARGGAALRYLDRLIGVPDPRLAAVELVAATDVDSPLLGIYGASAVFGPQKGATREGVARLDSALTRWADVLEAHLGVAVRDRPGAGAAGGLGAALLALGARREPGIALVQRLVGLDERVAQADLVITGEGTVDPTSLSGKVVSGVAASAAASAVPCVVLAGSVRVGRREAAAAGIEAAYALDDLVGLETALAQPAQSLEALSARLARQWSR